MDGVTKLYLHGFLLRKLFHIEHKISMFPISHPKITSGEISADEQQERAQGRVGTEQIISNEHHRQEVIKSVSSSKNLSHFKSTLQKSEATIVQARPSIHQPNHHPTPHHPHPEERIWAGQTPRQKPRVPGAPKIKHDKMKQFYMIDMGRKMW